MAVWGGGFLEGGAPAETLRDSGGPHPLYVFRGGKASLRPP